MKKFLRTFSIAIALMLILAATIPAAAAPPNPFAGVWESTDTLIDIWGVIWSRK